MTSILVCSGVVLVRTCVRTSCVRTNGNLATLRLAPSFSVELGGTDHQSPIKVIRRVFLGWLVGKKLNCFHLGPSSIRAARADRREMSLKPIQAVSNPITLMRACNYRTGRGGQIPA